MGVIMLVGKDWSHWNWVRHTITFSFLAFVMSSSCEMLKNCCSEMNSRDVVISKNK